MTRAFNIEGLVRLQNYMGGKTLSDAQFFAVLNADVVEMIDGEESTTKRRYFRIAENDESITFSCILGSSQQQMVVTKATKQLGVTTTEIGGGTIAPGSITTEMLADGAVTGAKIKDLSISISKLVDNVIVSSKIANGAVTSEKLAPGLDVSGLFFILPEGTQFPYTLTDDEYEKLSKASFMMLYSTSDAYFVLSPVGLTSKPTGIWLGIYTNGTLVKVSVTGKSISSPSVAAISDNSAVKFTSQTLSAAQKTQARTNIGAAEDPNTSGDPQATLEEPPVVDEEPIP